MVVVVTVAIAVGSEVTLVVLVMILVDLVRDLARVEMEGFRALPTEGERRKSGIKTPVTMLQHASYNP